ncbi:hypothetical protein Tco_0456468 [Tanacetum coccineum]
MARLWDLRTFKRAAFSSSFKSLQYTTATCRYHSKNLRIQRWGGSSLSSTSEALPIFNLDQLGIHPKALSSARLDSQTLRKVRPWRKCHEPFIFLLDEAIRNGPLKKNTEKRGNSGEPSRDRNEKDDNKRSRTGNAFATTANPVRREYTDALFFMPRFAPTIRNLLMNKEKLLELAKIPLTRIARRCSSKSFQKKLGDPEIILTLPELTPTRMTLELADQSITHPKGLAEDVYVKVGKFHFPTDFVVVDFEADPRVPLILRRSY